MRVIARPCTCTLVNQLMYADHSYWLIDDCSDCCISQNEAFLIWIHRAVDENITWDANIVDARYLVDIFSFVHINPSNVCKKCSPLFHFTFWFIKVTSVISISWLSSWFESVLLTGSGSGLLLNRFGRLFRYVLYRKVKCHFRYLSDFISKHTLR